MSYSDFSRYCVPLLLLLLLPVVSAPARIDGATKYRVLHNFTGGTDGYGSSGVTLDKKGNVYGPALGGGTGKCEDTCGLIFQLIPHPDGKWTETVLYNFQAGTDANSPSGTLSFDSAGNIYGTTQIGGAYNWGTVFELTPTKGLWTESILHSFCEPPDCLDGWEPHYGVVRSTPGDLYGAAGVAFELSHGSDGWQETMLHGFSGRNGDGDVPGAVLRDASGNLYGATEFGGIQCGGSTCGTVYELSPQSNGEWNETILYRFTGGADGAWPVGALMMDRHGDLYGTTINGGVYAGVVFKLIRASHGKWKETVLYSFQDSDKGYAPYSGVVADKRGNLYGTTDGGGGGGGCGVIYRLAPAAEGRWKYTVLHSFSGPDGCVPTGNLAIDQKGNLYGGAVLGGKYGYGVVFELTP